MKLELLPQAFTVCKLEDFSQVDATRPFCFIGKTDEELSLVCETDHTPPKTLARED